MATAVEWWSIPRAAHRVHKTYHQLYALALRGDLETRRIDGHLRVSRRSVEALRRRLRGSVLTSGEAAVG